MIPCKPLQLPSIMQGPALLWRCCLMHTASRAMLKATFLDASRRFVIIAVPYWMLVPSNMHSNDVASQSSCQDQATLIVISGPCWQLPDGIMLG